MKKTYCMLAGLALASSLHAADKTDDDMLKLASASGCMTCHSVDARMKGPDSTVPIGPAWRDVSAKYKGDTGAEEQLTRTVMAGSSPYESHWKGKVSGLAMPPNKVAITDSDAKKLVHWILSLDTKQ